MQVRSDSTSINSLSRALSPSTWRVAMAVLGARQGAAKVEAGAGWGEESSIQLAQNNS